VKPKGGEWEANDPARSKGVVIGAAQWPPQPITDHGKPKPEDDPANYEGGKRVRGPSDKEVEEARKKQRENSPFSNPNREGGTQAGGGGEGSSA